MLSSVLAADIESFLLSLEEAEALFDGLKQIEASSQRLEAPLVRIAHAGNELNPGATALHTALARTRDMLPQMSARAFFRAIDKVGGALNRLVVVHSSPPSRLLELRLELDEFAVVFERFTTDQNAVNALPVLRLGSKLSVAFEMLVASYTAVLRELQPEMPIEEDEESVSLHFDGDFSLEEIASMLAALDRIIEALAKLAHGDAMGPSSRVLKIESGSLLVNLAVLKTVSTILKPYLSAAAAFIYRNYTAEGRIRSMPGDAKAAVKNLLDVRALLVKAEIDTTGMDEQIENASIVMAESVVMLMKNQAGFKMGDRDYRAPKSNLRLNRDAAPLELPSPRDEPPPPSQQ